MWLDFYSYFIHDKPDVILYYKRFFKKGILLDTTPLMILLLGKYDADHGTKFLESLDIKILGTNRKIQLDDFNVFSQFLNSLSSYKFLITPHVFTEVVQQISDRIPDTTTFKTILDYLINDYSFLKEFSPNHKAISKNDLFRNLKLQIGDISLTMEDNLKSKTVITSDSSFLSISDNMGFLVISIQNLISARYSMPNIS